MSLLNWLTVVGGAVIAVLPQLVATVPSPYKDVVTAVLAAIVAAWHLWQPSPSTDKK